MVPGDGKVCGSDFKLIKHSCIPACKFSFPTCGGSPGGISGHCGFGESKFLDKFNKPFPRLDTFANFVGRLMEEDMVSG